MARPSNEKAPAVAAGAFIRELQQGRFPLDSLTAMRAQWLAAVHHIEPAHAAMIASVMIGGAHG